MENTQNKNSNQVENTKKEYTTQEKQYFNRQTFGSLQWATLAILTRINYPVNNTKFVSAVQSFTARHDFIKEPDGIKLAHATLANIVNREGSEDAQRAYIRRCLERDELFTKQTGYRLFEITRAETQTEKTCYKIDFLTPAAQALSEACTAYKKLPVWKKLTKDQKIEATDALIEDAISLLPKMEVKKFDEIFGVYVSSEGRTAKINLNARGFLTLTLSVKQSFILSQIEEDIFSLETVSGESILKINRLANSVIGFNFVHDGQQLVFVRKADSDPDADSKLPITDYWQRYTEPEVVKKFSSTLDRVDDELFALEDLNDLREKFNVFLLHLNNKLRHELETKIKTLATTRKDEMKNFNAGSSIKSDPIKQNITTVICDETDVENNKEMVEKTPLVVVFDHYADANTFTNQEFIEGDFVHNAKIYARRGWRVFPVHTVFDGICSCREGSECRNKAKHPRWHRELLPHGVLNAATDEKLIEEWGKIKGWNNSNVGVATGKESGIVVLDVDPKHGGDAALTELLDEHEHEMLTLFAKTGSPGFHLVFRHPGEIRVANTQTQNGVSKLGPGLDFRGDGGYIVVAPSLHASSNSYEWITPLDTEILPLPQFLLEKLLTTEKQEVKTDRPLTLKAVSDLSSRFNRTIPDGQRNDALMRIGCALVGKKAATQSEVEAELLRVNSLRCSPPLAESEVRKIARSVSRYPSILEVAR